MDIDTNELEDEFSAFGTTIGSPEILDRLKDLCVAYRLDVDSIVVQWVAYSHTNKNCPLTMENLDAMERSRLSKPSKSVSKTPKTKPEKKRVIHDLHSLEAAVGGGDDLLDSYATPNVKNSSMKRQHTPDQPTNKRLVGVAGQIGEAPFTPSSFSPSSATPSQKYSSRTNAGQVVCNHGDGGKVTWRSQSGTPSLIKHYDSNASIATKFKYMFVKLADKASVLDDLVEDFGLKLQKEHNIEEFAHISLPQQEQVTVLGRVCCDSVGKLNAKSVMLEGSRPISAGRRVPVDLSNVKQYSLFPGQVVAMDAINSTGTKLVATKIHDGPALPAPESPSIKEDGLRLLVACGPYTTSDSIMYEPFADLIKALQKSPPDVCILLGPFVDVKNPEMQKGDLGMTYEEFFWSTMENLASATQRLHTKLVIVPSIRDLHHDPVYPQPPFPKDSKSFSYEHVLFVSDPATLTIDGVVVGITSSDILFHLGGEETSCPPGSSDRLGRLARHLLTQQSYYPLYPPHDEMNVDYDHYDVYTQMTVKPHVLIIPSDLRYFVKDIDDCLCLNPGRLTKGHVGGTYARMFVQKPSSANPSISKNTVAEILRI